MADLGHAARMLPGEMGGPKPTTKLVADADGNFTRQAVPTPTTPLDAQRGLYNNAVQQQAGDYDTIMGGYKSLLGNIQNKAPISASTYNPNTFDYQPTQAFTSAMGNLKGLSESGGYSGSDINSLRERGISPIRSVYGNAEREMARAGRLSGGRSANYNATRAKMSREMSEGIAKQTNDVNAGIAERVAQNKIGLAPQLAGLAANQQTEQNRFGAANTDIMNAGQQFNINNSLDVQKANAARTNEASEALRGMTSLYGTTPALSNLFGDQVMQQAQFQNQQQQQQVQNANRMFNETAGRVRIG